MPKIFMQSCSGGVAEFQHRLAKQRRREQMENLVDDPNSNTKRIPLGKGHFALVDIEDYEMLNKCNWHVTAFGYAVRFIGRNVMWMHRIVIAAPIGTEVDHVNGNKLDNRKYNLRICNKRQNQGNRWKPKIPTTSRFKGVSRSKSENKFIAYGKENRRSIRLGAYESEIDAAKRYNEWASSYFGEFARLNPV